MATSLTDTGITFPNGTTQTTAGITSAPVSSVNGLTGAVDMTSLYSIGSYVVGRPLNTTNYAPNSTIAGSSLYSTTVTGAGGWQSVAAVCNKSGCTLYFLAPGDLVNTGSWRCVSRAWGTQTIQYNSAGISGLWVRYA